MRVELGAFINPDTVAAASVKSWVGKEVTLEESWGSSEAVVVLSSTSEEAPEDESGPDVTISTVTYTGVIGDVDIELIGIVVEDECVRVESGEKELFSEFKDVSVEDSASETPDVVLGVSTSSSFTEVVTRVDDSSARA